MDFILLFIIIIYSENVNIKIQYAAKNPGVQPTGHGPDFHLPQSQAVGKLTLSDRKAGLSPMTVAELSPENYVNLVVNLQRGQVITVNQLYLTAIKFGGFTTSFVIKRHGTIDMNTDCHII